MSALIIEARILVVPEDLEDLQRRSNGTLAGSTIAEIAGEHDPAFDEHQEIGFKPPAERKRIDALLAELHSFLNEGRPGNTIATDQQPQGKSSSSDGQLPGFK